MSAEKFAELLTEGIYKIRFAESKNIRAIQDELGYILGKKGGASIEYWRKGHIPPKLADIERLAREIVKRAQVKRTWLEEFLRSAGHPAPEKLCDELFPSVLSIETQPVHSTVPAQEEDLADVEKNLFVAREEELAQLDNFLHRVLEKQQGRVVFVTGEAGSGKTALVEEFAWRTLEARVGLVVAGGACNAYTGDGDPYLPFREILGLLTDDRETRWAAKAVVQKNAHRLRNLLPHVVEVLVNTGPDLIGPFISGSALVTRAEKVAPGEVHWLGQLRALVARKAADRGPSIPPQINLFDQYTKVLRMLARRKPLLLVLDDLQWADRGSIDLLSRLGKSLDGSPILIVGTYRPADVALGRAGERHPLEPLVNELQRHFGSIQIDLKQAMDKRFVEAILDIEPNRLDATFREALYQHTRGHALFTVEMLRSMQKRGDLVEDESGRWVEGPALNWETLPARVDGVIKERIGRLPATLQETLKVASIEGENFLAEVVARTQAVDEWAMVRQLSGILDKQHRLVRGEVSQRLGNQPLSHYRFRHILFQQYLYNSLDNVELVYLHEVVGKTKEDLYTEQADEIAVELARHFQKAGLTAKAINYLSRAGKRALRLSANQEAIVHFKKALALLQTLPETPERIQQELDIQTSLGPALIPIKGYANKEVEQTYIRAQELCQQMGEAPQVLWVVAGLWVYYFVRAKLQKAREFAEQLLQLAESVEDPTVYLQAYRTLGATLCAQGEFTLNQTYCEQGITLYASLPDHSRQVVLSGQDPGVSYFAYSSLALWYLGYPGQALKQSRESIVLAQNLAHPFSQTFALGIASFMHHLRREPQVVLERSEAALKISNEKGFTSWIIQETILQGWALTQQVPEKAAITSMRQALDQWRASGAELLRPYFLLILAETYGIIGQTEAGLTALAEALTAAHNNGDRWVEAELYRLKGELLLRQGEAETQVEACFNQALNVAYGQNAKSLELRTVMSLSRLWLGQGRKAEGRHRLAEIYNWFTEGFDTPDLRDARALLEALS